jgi:outer membrane protein OmpA-like peptidoglycan-associated protein
VLDENFRNESGKKISRLYETAGVHDTSALKFFGDGLFHFTRWERLDPYLSLGVGLTRYADDLGNGQTDAAVRFGGGVMYHFNDEWAVRADGRGFIAGEDTEANVTVDAGVVWCWGARVDPDYLAVGGVSDTDGDGLGDDAEIELGTDPENPDTDGDDLTDGEEVLDYRTNPLDPDTDLDALKDGEEVKQYRTDPRDRDTDDGGVADGHEVIEDKTDPLDGEDDLILFELDIKFDYDQAVLKPAYYEDLDKIAMVLSRYPESTARIEGHADKTAKSDAKYNVELSERRAKAVAQYLSKSGNIDVSRLKAVGYGFSRPREENDPKKGNPRNRRVEVYIRKDGAASAPAAEAGSQPAAEQVK